MQRFTRVALRLALGLSCLASAVRAAEAAAPAASPAPALLDKLVKLARERAPEVVLGRAALTASRSSYASASLAPLGNPSLEVKADRGTQGVTKDITIDASLWLPVELAGQKQGRGREARDYVRLHDAWLAQARAIAAGRTVRAYGALAVATTRGRVLEEILAGARAESEYYAARLAAGDATERDAALAALEAARHEVLLSETQRDVVHSAGELLELTGWAHGAGTVLEATTPGWRLRTPLAARDVRTPTTVALEEQARYYGSAAERIRREAWAPLSLGVTGGRGDYGEARFGAGVGYAFPVFRSNQAERARAEAERARALEELSLRQSLIARRIGLVERELVEVARAVELVSGSALPAATRAVNAATETHRAGKGDWLSVLVSRRDLSALSLRRLELLDKSWSLLGELTELTGELP
jgi:outer membrane protein TolC